MLNLKQLYQDYHTSSKSFAELVPWMSMVEPGMVVNLDGSLLVIYSFEGVDAEGLLRDESDRYANVLEHALRVFDDHISLWSIVDRRKTHEYLNDHFSSPVGQFINDRWSENFTGGNQFVNRHYMAFMYSPVKGAEGFFESVAAHLKTYNVGLTTALFDTFKSTMFKDVAIQSHFEQLDSMMMIFNSKLREFEETISDLRFSKLENEKLLEFLHSRCSPATAGQPVAMPEVPAYLNTWLADNTLDRKHDHLIFGDIDQCHVGAITVKRWPSSAAPGIMDTLLSVPTELTVSQVFRFLDSDKAKAMIASIEEHHRASSKSLLSTAIEAFTQKPSDQIDTGKLMLAEDAQRAMVKITKDKCHFGYYNMTILGYGKTKEELKENLKLIATSLRQRGFILLNESMHLLAAFTTTLPGQWATNVRWSVMNTANVTDLAMIRTIDVGSKKNVYLTEQTNRPQSALTMFQTDYSTPYYFSFHLTDLAHTLVVGPSRSGKSTLVNFLISQFEKHYPCNRIIFDKDYSTMIPTLLQEGTHIDMDPKSGSSPKLNPFKLLSDPKNINWLVEFVKMLITSRGYTLGPTDDQTLLNAMQRLSDQPEAFWTLSHYVVALGNEDLARLFDNWKGGGQYGKYFDNDEDQFDLGSFVSIEMGGLLDDEVGAPFMEYAFFKVNQMLDGRPTLIYIEECWFMLANPTFAAKLNDWLRTLGKKNAFVIMATQSLQEIASNEYFSTIIDNIQNRIFLANPSADAHIDLYRDKFQLNAAQIARITNAIPKQQYYFVTPKFSRMINARFPNDLAACLRSDARSKDVFKKHYKNGAGANNWQFDYVEERIA